MAQCEYCGNAHPVTALCRANRGQMTRRRFLFLFGAGVAATVTAAALGIDLGHLGKRELFYRGARLYVDQHLAHRDLIIVDAKTMEAYYKLLGTDARYVEKRGGITYGELERRVW